MSDNMEVKAVLTAEDRASAVVRGVRLEIERLSKSIERLATIKVPDLKASAGASPAARGAVQSFANADATAMRASRQRLAFAERMNRQRAGEARTEERRQRADAAATVRAFRDKAAMAARMARQHAADDRAQERQRRAAEAATQRDFRSRMAFANAMGRQRTREHQAGERQRADAAADRDAAAALRRRIGLDNYRFGLRARYERDQAAGERRAQRDQDRQTRARDRGRADVRREVHHGANRTSDVASRAVDVAQTVSVYGGIAGGIVAKMAEIGLRSRSAIDTAEANLRMFGGQSREQVETTRSTWLNRAAIENGFRPADALAAFTETLKAGIPQTAAPDVTRSIMGASAGLDLNVAETTKLVGRLSTLTQDPKKSFAPEAIDRMLNAIAVVAKVTAADSNELVSSLRRGAGVLGSSKMSVGDLTAFTGTAISAGMQEGKAGTFLDFTVNELVNAKNAHGQRRKDLDKGFNLLGIGSAYGVSRQAANDPTALIMKVFERLSKMTPEKAGQVASLIFQREWRGEALMMAKAAPTLRPTVEAQRDPKNASHLAQARNERLGTLRGLGEQIRATFDLAWEAIGGGIEDIVREIGAFFLNLGKNLNLNVIKAHVSSLVNGFVDGLGFANVTQMLDRVFGKPDFSTVNSFFRFAQGFGQGVREVVDTIASTFRMFAGRDTDAETVGRLMARILGLSAALVVLSPVISVIAGLATALGALTLSAIGISKAVATLSRLGALGVATEAGAAAPAAGAGGILGRLLGALKLAPAVAMPLTIDPSKADQDKLMGRLGRWAQERERERNGETGTAPVWRDPPARVQKQSASDTWRGLIQPASFHQPDDRIVRALERISEIRAARSEADGENGRANLNGLIRPAAFDPISDLNRTLGRVASTFHGPGAQVASITAPGIAAVSSFSGGGGFGGAPGASGGGGYLAGLGHDPARALSGFGRSRMGADGLPDPGTGAGAGPYKATLDYIAKAEGTAGRGDYNASLGYGRFLPGERETNLTGKSLNEILALGDHMRRQPGNPNSSALGRYQIVGQTLRALMGKLGLSGSEKFDEAMQDRLGAELVRQRGANATGLGSEWASLKGGKGQEAAALVGQIPRGASTMPGLREAGTAAPGTGGTGGAASAADNAAKLLGANSQQAARALGATMSPGQWCADFVNGALKAGGVSGVKSSVANSFLRWGQAVGDGAKKGDVLVEHRGRGVDQPGGHVGLATGQTRMRNGRLEYETVSGNHGGRVGQSWVDSSKVAVRRAIGDTVAKAGEAVDGFKAAGTKPASPGMLQGQARDLLRPRNAFGGVDSMSPEAAAKGSGRQAPTAGTLAGSVPSAPTASALADQVPTRLGLDAGGTGFQKQGGGGRAGGDVHIHQVIHGAGENPQELAGKVQKHVTEAWNYRSHDLEPELS